MYILPFFCFLWQLGFTTIDFMCCFLYNAGVGELAGFGEIEDYNVGELRKRIEDNAQVHYGEMAEWSLI